MKTLPVLAIGAGVLLAGCSAPSSADPAPASPSAAKPGALTGVEWQLATDRTAWFKIAENRLTGKDSCNNLMGGVRISGGNQVDFGRGPASTMMACPDSTGAQDAIRAALGGIRVWDRAGDQLTLTDPTSKQSWKFTAAGAAPASGFASPGPTVPPR